MLVLSRYPGESIVIRTPEGRTITVQIVQVRDTEKVRIGFSADRDVSILRSELDGQELKTLAEYVREEK